MEIVRKLLWRFGRKLYCWARGDVPNNPEVNGEYWLLQLLLKHSATPLSLFDVGANKGDWSKRALDLAREKHKELAVFAFEPSEATRHILCERLVEQENCRNLTVLPFALSDSEGDAFFYSRAAGAGTNSLDASSGSVVESVRLTTVDAVMRVHGIKRGSNAYRRMT